MSHLSIIPLTERPDMAEICASWSFSEWGCHKPNPCFENVARRYRETAQNKTTGLPKTFVGIVENKAVGMISLKNEDHPDCKDIYPWVASFFIHPYFRGNGYAHKFIEHVDNQARQLEFKRVYLYTPDAERLYKKHGWERFDQKRDPTELHDHVVLMRKNLF